MSKREEVAVMDGTGSRQARPWRWTATALAAATLAACGSGEPSNDLPKGFTELGATVYPATAPGTGSTAATQDLLTGGLGKTGLGAAAAPAYADPANPTAAELRRNALYSNYRGILDPSAGGGYGTLYGPNITADGQVTAGEGLIPGREYLAVLDDGTGRKQTMVAVQVPDSFDRNRPCIVLGPSSGSRGVYGGPAQPERRYGEQAGRHARHAHGRGQPVLLCRAADRCGARRLQRGLSQPHCHQARAFPAEP
jgi:hydroxybutyrate-dimer hydrolase